MEKKSRLDTDASSSERTGLGGALENALRRFRILMHALFLLPLYTVACACISLALLPSFYLLKSAHLLSLNWPEVLRFLLFGFSLGASYFAFGFSLLFLLPLLNFVTRSSLVPWRGSYYSLESVRWYIHNGAVYLIRYSFLEMITPSPFLNLFYQMMGMKIGRGTVINSTHISDPSLITIGAKVTIGGSATIVGHYGQGGYLVLARVQIGDGATIGLKATIMGGAQIGAGAKILPNSVVMPNTVVGDGELWGGVPAAKLQTQPTGEKKSTAA
jgi:acetyltransferase-like isoleucine patch superfamily enzyme